MTHLEATEIRLHDMREAVESKVGKLVNYDHINIGQEETVIHQSRITKHEIVNRLRELDKYKIVQHLKYDLYVTDDRKDAMQGLVALVLADRCRSFIEVENGTRKYFLSVDIGGYRSKWEVKDKVVKQERGARDAC
ncbi:hypothetical protein MWH25_08135 [Natroniella acetigena]|uniref:hypothetical protein n=1 Tax=Natroniella acetigena TaxID=52004 RepID=UPI00200B65B0|nr:hypothetical protein [Natroniella acetigena]MCK8827711.1 hypothetical protein [Natroniella acetigena]